MACSQKAERPETLDRFVYEFVHPPYPSKTMSSTVSPVKNGKNGHSDVQSTDCDGEESAPKRLKVENSVATSTVPLDAIKIDSSNSGAAADAPLLEHDIFGKFKFKKVLKADASRKIAFIHGDLDGEDAVVILEQCAFNLDTLGQLFAAKADGQLEFKNDIYHNYRVFFPKEFSATKTTLIYPATQAHIDKFGQQPMYIVDENPEDYQNLTFPALQSSKKFDTKWVDNILDHEKEQDRIVFEDPDKENGFILLPDLKWDGRNVESLYLIALPHRRGIHSIRDLTGEHLEMLKKIKQEGAEAITKKYGLPASRIRAFFHYQPTFYHLHIHFTNIQFDAPGRNAEKAHMLTTVISNLKQDGGYYQQATIPFGLGEKDPLFKVYSSRILAKTDL